MIQNLPIMLDQLEEKGVSLLKPLVKQIVYLNLTKMK